MVKMVRIEFAASAVKIEDEKEVLWKTITNSDFDWSTPLLIKDSTNPMNDMILNLDRVISIKRYDKNTEEIEHEKENC